MASLVLQRDVQLPTSELSVDSSTRLSARRWLCMLVLLMLHDRSQWLRLTRQKKDDGLRLFYEVAGQEEEMVPAPAQWWSPLLADLNRLESWRSWAQSWFARLWRKQTHGKRSWLVHVVFQHWSLPRQVAVSEDAIRLELLETIPDIVEAARRVLSKNVGSTSQNN